MKWCILTLFSCLSMQVNALPEPAVENLGPKATPIPSFLYGLWEGSGFIIDETGRHELESSSECVYPKLDGKVSVVEGMHLDEEDNEVFKTFGILSHIDGSDFNFSVFLKNDLGHDGYRGIFPAQIDADEQTWKWSFTFPVDDNEGVDLGKVRYDITISENQWAETGEVSIDGGETWTQNFGMTLTKTSGSCSGF